MHPLKLLSNKPSSFSIEITTRCPLKCKYCDRRGTGADMSYDKFLVLKDRLDQVPGLDRVVFCGIGESLMNRNFYRMIHELKNYKVTMITSGTILLNYDEIYKYNNIDMLIFSIDATSEDLIRSICGETYNYRNLIKNINDFGIYNKKNKWEKGHITSLLNCTVNANNIDEIPKLVDFAALHKFNIIHYSLPWGQERFIADNLELLKEKFALAREMARKSRIITDDPFHSYCCITNNGILPFINMEGEVFPCAFALNQYYSAGNIFSNNFDTIWESPKYENFRTGSLCSSCYLIRMGLIEQKIIQ